MKITTIQPSVAVRRFNTTVETLDKIYGFDTQTIPQMLVSLEARGWDNAAELLRDAARPLGYLDPPKTLPCGCRYEDRDLCGHGNAPLA